jgi:hypothetical protein
MSLRAAALVTLVLVSCSGKCELTFSRSRHLRTQSRTTRRIGAVRRIGISKLVSWRPALPIRPHATARYRNRAPTYSLLN